MMTTHAVRIKRLETNLRTAFDTVNRRIDTVNRRIETVNRRIEEQRERLSQIAQLVDERPAKFEKAIRDHRADFAKHSARLNNLYVNLMGRILDLEKLAYKRKSTITSKLRKTPLGKRLAKQDRAIAKRKVRVR